MQQILDARVSTESQPGVLETAIDEYKHFLQQARSCDTLVPSLLVDLVWHTHQQFSNAYAADCIALAGRLIDHDDDLTHVILDVTLMENNGVLPV